MFIVNDAGLGVSIDDIQKSSQGTGNAVKFFNDLYSSLNKLKSRLTINQLERIQYVIQNIQRCCERKSPVIYYLQSYLNPSSNAYKIKNIIPSILNIAKIKATLPAVDLPDDVFPLIFKHLQVKELRGVSTVCKSWQFFASAEIEKKIESIKSIHAGVWENLSCQLSNIPVLPKNIFQILDSPCPFWPGKKIEETHFLTLIPKTINEELYHPIALEKIILSFDQEFKMVADVDIHEQYGQYSEDSHWILITKEPVPSSENKTYNEQLSLIKNAHYDAPSYLEAATAIFVNSTETIFSTRCKESKIDHSLSAFTNWEIVWNVSIRKINREMFISYYIADPEILAVRRL